MTEQHYEWARAEERTLARYVQPDALPAGFQFPKDRNRLDILHRQGPGGVLAQLYILVRKSTIQYDLAPFNPRSGISQRIRTPKTILTQKHGTCLDLAMLFAAMSLSNDLLPLIVVVDGHAFAGISLVRTRQDSNKAPKPFVWDRGKLTSLRVLQELSGQEYLFFECTGAAQSQALSPTFPEGREREADGGMSYERACEAGSEQIHSYLRDMDEEASPMKRLFLYALDIHDLQINQGFEPVQAKAEGTNVTHTIFDQSGQTLHGSQINIAGDAQAPIHIGDHSVANKTIPANFFQQFIDKLIGQLKIIFGKH